MANSFYFTPYGGAEATLYIAGTTTDKFFLGEVGWGMPEDVIIVDEVPDAEADIDRGVVIKPRLYAVSFRLNAASASALETLRDTWLGNHDPLAGIGVLKRITSGGKTRYLDCRPRATVFTPLSRLADGYCQVLTQTYFAATPWWRSAAQTATGNLNAAVTIANSGLETGGTGDNFNGGTEADDGTSDNFTSWTETNDDGAGNKCEATATAQAGSYACKLTYGAGEAAIQSANLTVVAGQGYTLTFYARGDASKAGQYSIYDVTHGADVVAKKTTGVTAGAFAAVTETFTAPAGCTSIYVKFYSPSSAGYAIFDAVSMTASTILISCANGGDRPSWPVITITGVVNTPKIQNAAGDYVQIAATTANADDVLVINHRPGSVGVTYYEHGAGAGANWYGYRSSASEFWKLPVGTANVTVSATSGTCACALSWYPYYRSL